MTADTPTTAREAELKPCAHCGGAGHQARVGQGMEIICQSCGAAGPLSPDRAAAVAAWNRRPPSLPESAALKPSDLRNLIASLLQFGPSPDGAVERDIEAAIQRLEASSPSLPESAGEPVAWRYRYFPGWIWHMVDTLEAVPDKARWPELEVEPLYASPPAPVAAMRENDIAGLIPDETMRYLLVAKDVGTGRARLNAILSEIGNSASSLPAAPPSDDAGRSYEDGLRDGNILAGNDLNRRVEVENALLNFSAGKRPPFTPEEARALAHKLGVPEKFHVAPSDEAGKGEERA